VSKRNLAHETIGNLFLILQRNVKKIRHCTSEPSEHTFGNCRLCNREFTVGDFCLISEKLKRRMAALFEGDLSPSKTANKGYQATFLDWVTDAKCYQEEGGPCDIDLSSNAESVVFQLWGTAQKVIHESVRLVTPLLKLFDVGEEEMSPFCKEFASCRDLLETYVAYCPKTFSYKGISGGGFEKEREEDADDDMLKQPEQEQHDQKEVSDMIARFEHFTMDLMAAVASDDTNEEEDDDEFIKIVFEEKASESTAKSSSLKQKEKANLALVVAFKKFCTCERIEDLFGCILHFSAAIESLDNKLESSSLSQSRKTKTLFQRWASQKILPEQVDAPSNQGSGDLKTIGRDSIITCKLKLGNRKDNPEIPKDYRVLAVYEKFYNKWWMSRDKKLWSLTMDPNIKNKYRLAVRMVEDGAIEAFDDVSLNNETYPKKIVLRMISGNDVMDVKGVALSSNLD